MVSEQETQEIQGVSKQHQLQHQLQQHNETIAKLFGATETYVSVTK